MDDVTEHDVAHQIELSFGGGGDFGVVVTVDDGPPGGQGVDEFFSIGQVQSDAGSGDDLNGRAIVLHLGVGEPNRIVHDGAILAIISKQGKGNLSVLVREVVR